MRRKEFNVLTNLLPESVANMIWESPFLMEQFINNTPKKPSAWWIEGEHLPFDQIGDDYDEVVRIASEVELT